MPSKPSIRVLTRGGTTEDTPYEEHQVPAGMKDVKSIKDARPFTGERSDAKPFLTRLKAYFQARPNAMKFTKNRILYTVDLMGARKRRIWSSMVRKAIAEQLDNEYYFNNWDEFQAAFIKMFGLTNETQPYLARLFAYKMGKDKDLKDFVAYFEHLRSELGARTPIPTGNMLNTLGIQSTNDSNVPSGKKWDTFKMCSQM